MNEQIPEAITKALEFERSGAIFYLETAAKIKSRLVRRLLHNLAMEEIQHLQDIEGVCQDIEDEKIPKELDKDTREIIEGTIKSLFKVKKDELSEDATDLDVLKVAMDVEEKGYKMYVEAGEASDNLSLKEFFNRLAEEEQDHMAALKNVYHYLSDPEDWLAQAESQL